MTSSKLSSFFNQIATPFETKNSAFSSSCPGIGLIITIGRPQAKVSVVVRPPGFVTTRDAICINSGTLSVKPKTFILLLALYSFTNFLNSCFIFSFFPAIATI